MRKMTTREARRVVSFARGVPKNFTAEERQKRRERMLKVRHLGGRKVQKKIEQAE